MSEEKLTTVKFTLEQRFYDEIAGWAQSLEPPATPETILQSAAIMLAIDEAMRETVAHKWQQAALD